MPRNTIPSVQVGDKFGLWTIIELNAGWSGNRPGGNVKDKVRCECGTVRAVQRSALKGGRSLSCGEYPCYKKINGRKRGNPNWASHGLSSEPLYDVWLNMKKRCKPGSPMSHRYYDRGIRVWPDWEHDFKAFFGYIMGNLGPRPEGASLDRIDNDRGYEPGNLRWATAKQQIDNQTRKKKTQRRKSSQAYKRNGPAYEPEPLRVRPVHVPPHLAQQGWTTR